MSKALSVLVALSLFVPAIASASFDTNLKYGATGSPVTELQEFLADQTGYAGPITGNFYSLTLAAVKKFQIEHQLPSTGYFGPMSRTVANSLLAAETSVSDIAEQTEIGTTTTPVDTSPINQLNQKITDLNKQIAEQKAAQDETNKKLGQIVLNTAPPMAPTTVPALTPTIEITAVALNPTKLAQDGTVSVYEPVIDGGTIYASVITGFGSYAPSGYARIQFSSSYLAGGVTPSQYSGTWSYSPWEANMNGLDDQRTSFPICNQGYPTCGTNRFGGSFGLTTVGLHTFTVTIGNVTKTFTVNVAENPVCAGISISQCAADYTNLTRAYNGQSAL